MTEREKSVLLWLIVAFAFFVGLWFCRGAQPIQGDAAWSNLAALHLPKRIGPEPIPAFMPPPPLTRTNVLEWDYPQTDWAAVANFRIYQSHNRTTNWTSNWLAGKVLSNDVVRIRGWTNTYAASTIGTDGIESELSNLISLPAHVPSKLIVRITGNNLAWSTNGFYGPWTTITGTTVMLTNPIGPRKFWQGKPARETHSWQ